MAHVYLARDVRLGREVAVKVLDERLAERSGFRERFLREARVAAALDHPNIVPLYDFGESEFQLYLVMPYISGGSLQDALRRAPLPVGEVVTYGSQMADALDYAHQRSVVHRDVKPANMLVHSNGRLMLADFGLAKILSSAPRPSTPRNHPDAGTPEYMAPEQIEGRTDERSDIYGLGVVLYLLMTGHLPFTGPTSHVIMDGHLHRLPEQPRRLNPAVSPAMQAVILRALAKHPEDRFQKASELGAALLEALIAGDAAPLPFTLGTPEPPASYPPFAPGPSFGSAYGVASQVSAHSVVNRTGPSGAVWEPPRIGVPGQPSQQSAAARSAYPASAHSDALPSLDAAIASGFPAGPLSFAPRSQQNSRITGALPLANSGMPSGRSGASQHGPTSAIVSAPFMRPQPSTQTGPHRVTARSLTAGPAPNSMPLMTQSPFALPAQSPDNPYLPPSASRSGVGTAGPVPQSRATPAARASAPRDTSADATSEHSSRLWLWVFVALGVVLALLAALLLHVLPSATPGALLAPATVVAARLTPDR